MVPHTNGGNKQITEVLLQYDGLLTSIIQWSFWTDRPDIERTWVVPHVELLLNLGGVLHDF